MTRPSPVIRRAPSNATARLVPGACATPAAHAISAEMTPMIRPPCMRSMARSEKYRQRRHDRGHWSIRLAQHGQHIRLDAAATDREARHGTDLDLGRVLPRILIVRC